MLSPTHGTSVRRRSVLIWLFAIPALASMIAFGFAAWLLPMTSRETWTLVLYVGATSVLGIGVGWLVLGVFDRVFHPSLAIVAFAATVIGAVAVVAEVAILASLMFVNTGHDLRLLVILLLSSAVVTVAFSVNAATRTGRQLHAIGDAIGRLSRLDYSEAAPLAGRGGAEIARLADDVERLRARLSEVGAEREALDNDRRYLTAAISHDLRTPVATVHALVDALEDGVVDQPDEIVDYYRRIRREAERLTRMIDDLRELAAIDAGALNLDRGMIGLQDIAQEVVESVQPLAARADITVSLVIPNPLPPVCIDAQRMERVVANLVRNAIGHSPPESEVTVEVHEVIDGVVLGVHDRGQGLSESDITRIWDRFYRGEASRQRPVLGSDGSGLGLAIVRGIVEAHGGRATAAARPGGGASFEIWLPA